MNHLEFVKAGLHNRHIRFFDNNDKKIKTGVVIDFQEDITKQNDYTFIPTEHMMKWKDAEKREAMNNLSLIIDIENIIWGELI